MWLIDLLRGIASLLMILGALGGLLFLFVCVASVVKDGLPYLRGLVGSHRPDPAPTSGVDDVA